jgi:hypothetical protein
MLFAEINKGGETYTYRLHKNIRLQAKLKAELYERFSRFQKVTITENGKTIDILLLEDLFCEPIERVRNAGLILPGK